jgi:quercetin dioxygenase-like cupin family protein
VSGAAPSLRAMVRARGGRFLVTALGAAMVLCGLLPAAFGNSKATPTVVRNALAQTEHVQGASGRTLILSRVVVEPGAQLPLHRHLGTQVARVVSGVLTYKVRHGSVVVRSGDPEQRPVKVRSITAGQTGRIRAGQWIVEQPSTIHEAANDGSQPVVIYIATLLKTGAPPATPVTLPAGG